VPDLPALRPRWRTGTAHFLPDDDMLTIRVDLDPRS
jgi:hypothetical protein